MKESRNMASTMRSICSGDGACHVRRIGRTSMPVSGWDSHVGLGIGTCSNWDCIAAKSRLIRSWAL